MFFLVLTTIAVAKRILLLMCSFAIFTNCQWSDNVYSHECLPVWFVHWGFPLCRARIPASSSYSTMAPVLGSSSQRYSNMFTYDLSMWGSPQKCSTLLTFDMTVQSARRQLPFNSNALVFSQVFLRWQLRWLRDNMWQTLRHHPETRNRARETDADLSCRWRHLHWWDFVIIVWKFADD